MNETMAAIPLHLLIVEDSEDDAEILIWELRRAGFDVDWQRVETAEAMTAALAAHSWDLILADYIMPRFSGLQALELVKATGLDIPFIIVSGQVGEDIAVAAMRSGASDYLLKGHLARLVPVIQRELHESKARRIRRQEQKELYLLKKAIGNLPLGVTITDLERRIVFTNRAEAEMHGYTVDELIGQSVRILAPPEAWLEHSLHELAFDSIFSRESVNQRKDGSRFPAHIISNVVTEGEERVPIALISTCEDITERKRLEMVLRRQMTAIESAMDGIAVVDQFGTISYVNQAFAGIFGFNLATDLVGMSWESRFVSSDQERLQREICQQVQRRGNWRGELIGCRSNNVLIPLEVTITQIEQDGTVCILRDISERKLAEERLRYLSTHDALTGFYNGTYLEGEMDRLDRSRLYPISVLMADVDCLKRVNDTQGHHAGDELLRLAARCIAGAFRAEDVVARIGGDEFLVLLPETDAAAAAEALERIRENVAAMNHEQAEFRVSLSLGAATATRQGALDETVRLADQLMYVEKQRKRSGCDEP